MAQNILGSNSEDEEYFKMSFEMDDDWFMALENDSNENLLLTGIGFLCCRPQQDPLDSDDVFVCNTCKVTFTSQLSLENHLKNDEKDKTEPDYVPSESLAQVYKRNNTFYCIHCKYNSTYLTHIRGHLLKHKLDDPDKFKMSKQSLVEDAVFTCEICKVLLTSQLDLEIHKKLCKKNQDDVNDDPEIAPRDLEKVVQLCERNTTDLLKHKGNDLHEIEVIRNAPTKDKPRTLQVPNGNKQFKCTFSGCLYSSDKKFEIHRHIARHGGKIILMRMGSVYRCNQCKHTCLNGSNMRKHMNTHKKERPFQCAHCPFKAKQRNTLIFHLETHSLIKQYKCSQCEFRTSYKSSLNKHIAMHKGDFKHKCSQCDYKTTRSACLTAHMMIHTSEKPFHCPHCPYRASQKSYLIEHLRVHTGEKPYACANCEYKSAKRSALNKHVEMVHK